MTDLAVLTVGKQIRGLFGGPAHGAEYSMTGACARCGTGALQTGRLLLQPFSLPREPVFLTMDDEVLVLPSLADDLRRAGVGCLRRVRDARSGNALEVSQLVPEATLPPFDGARTRGVTRARSCPVCQRDGYYGMASEPYRLCYTGLDPRFRNLELLAIFERFGTSAHARVGSAPRDSGGNRHGRASPQTPQEHRRRGAFLVAVAYILAVPLTLWAGSQLTAELSFARPVPIRQLLPDGRVWSWSGVLAMLIIAAMSLPQAAHTLRVAPVEGLHGAGRASRALGWTGRFVVAAQVLLSLLLIVSAGLLLTTRSNLYANVGGLDDARVMFARLSRVPGDRGPLSSEYFGQLLNELGGLPGVERAALASTFPAYAGFVGAMPLNTFTAAAAGAQVEARGLIEYITPGFLSTLVSTWWPDATWKGTTRNRARRSPSLRSR